MFIDISLTSSASLDFPKFPALWVMRKGSLVCVWIACNCPRLFSAEKKQKVINAPIAEKQQMGEWQLAICTPWDSLGHKEMYKFGAEEWLVWKFTNISFRVRRNLFPLWMAARLIWIPDSWKYIKWCIVFILEYPKLDLTQISFMPESPLSLALTSRFMTLCTDWWTTLIFLGAWEFTFQLFYGGWEERYCNT